MKRWCAWAVEHDAHGASLDTLVFLPEGEHPDLGVGPRFEWTRLPWLDQPAPPEPKTGLRDDVDIMAETLPSPMRPACAWNDLGGCDDERVPVTFKHEDVPRHLCRPHYEDWYRQWRSAEALDGCPNCRLMAEARDDAMRSSNYWQEQFRSAMKPRKDTGQLSTDVHKTPEHVCDSCAGPLGSKYYQGVPGRGNLCFLCHEKLFPPP